MWPIWMVLGLIVLSTVIGAVAKLLNNLQEASTVRQAERDRRERYERADREKAARAQRDDERAERPSRPRAAPTAETSTAGAVRTPTSDMDRFLAEIDRLRRKQTADPPPAQPGSATPVAPVVQPIKPPPERERPRARVVAELAETSAAAANAAAGFSTMPQAPTRAAPVAGQIEELPVAQVLRPSSSTGAPATKVTKFFGRARPAAKTNFGKNLTALLGSGQGVAMAVVLQEILGPPKAKKNAAEKQA